MITLFWLLAPGLLTTAVVAMAAAGAWAISDAAQVVDPETDAYVATKWVS